MFAVWDTAYSDNAAEAKLSQGWLAILLPAAFVAGVTHLNWQLRATGFRVYSTPTVSMAPAIPLNSRVMVDSRRYRHSAPQRGDMIVFPLPRDNKVLIVKRVIAVGGETIEIRGDKVMINGEPISEPYVVFTGPLPDIAERTGPTTLPAGKAFVMGDNRHKSFDSRMYGPIDLSTVRGKVIYIVPSLTCDLKTFKAFD